MQFEPPPLECILPREYGDRLCSTCHHATTPSTKPWPRCKNDPVQSHHTRASRCHQLSGAQLQHSQRHMSGVPVYERYQRDAVPGSFRRIGGYLAQSTLEWMVRHWICQSFAQPPSRWATTTKYHIPSTWSPPSSITMECLLECHGVEFNEIFFIFVCFDFKHSSKYMENDDIYGYLNAPYSTWDHR